MPIYWSTIAGSLLMGVWIAFWFLMKLGYIECPPFDLLFWLFMGTIFIIILVREKWR